MTLRFPSPNTPKCFAFSTLAGALLLSLLVGCSDTSNSSGDTGTAGDDILMNQVQYLGTHNSYHVRARQDLFDVLLSFIPDLAPTLDYSHIPLQEQFDTQGIRQIELDVFDDPEGGLYANHRARRVFGDEVASGIAELDEPGLKVLHVQEIDYETTCYTFVSCLEEVKAWSDANPRHLPITVLVEVKDEAIPDPLSLGFVTPLPFGIDALNRIDAEIRSVFPREQLLLPDDVRGDFVTLELAVLSRGWPPLSQARGKIMFALDNTGSPREDYIAGHTSLEGRVLFTDSPAGTPEAAFMKRNNPLSNPGDIESLVELGYMVRTRADADTEQARTNDTTQRDAALASGAHFISTDYPVPNPEFSEYQVTLPGGGVARCNSVNPGTCNPDFL
ncbi:MAG: phosphatidylinositol-specific phospholipase C1-like protein [Halioglobus sp.]|nr:phosphatidylinositol-specific phospholipase C1-like protein [Halioglobus sp.]